MAEERLRKAADAAFDVVRTISGHPDVSMEEAAEILLLAKQRAEAARLLSGLDKFSAEDIALARQFIESSQPAVGASITGFETVKRILDVHQTLLGFTEADEALVNKFLKGSKASYNEPIPIKVGKFIQAQGFIAGSPYEHLISRDYISEPISWDYPLSNFHLINVASPKPEQREERKHWWRDIEVIMHPVKPIYIGTIDVKNDWTFWASNHAVLPTAAILGKRISEQFDRKVNITLLHT